MYRIKHWAIHFENAESRKVKGARWLPMPNKHDGKGFRRMSRHARKVEILCAWTLILQVASKCPERGDLADENGPLTAIDLADSTGFPDEIFELAFQVLTDPTIGWIEVIPWPVPEDMKISRARPDETAIPPDETGKPPEASGRSSGKPEKSGKEGIEGREGTELRKEDPPPSPRPVTPYDQAVTDILAAYPKTRERDGGRSEQVHVGEGDRVRIAEFMNLRPDYPLLEAVKAYAKATKRPKNLREWLLNPTAREIVLKAMEAAKARDNPTPGLGPEATEEEVRAMARDVLARLNGGASGEARRMQNAA